uniref:Inositol hexakisphosphate and diphosphoinositol-pentakisphosphate kinase n=1 Tax=Trichobilharzia regenti TaxID=157069 RepID=A0AA85JF68_TRIRE|nr:unnamed protein product [Trichobilharzia regenti]
MHPKEIRPTLVPAMAIINSYSKGVASPERFVRSRLYFTSESHIHSLLTCLRYGDLADVLTDEQWRRAMDYVSSVSEINYLAQIVIMIYEDPTVEPKTEKRFHVELHFSPGAFALCHDLPEGSGFRSGKLERLNSQVSVVSSGTSVDKGSSDSMPQSLMPSIGRSVSTCEQDKRMVPDKQSSKRSDQSIEHCPNPESFDSSDMSFSGSYNSDRFSRCPSCRSNSVQSKGLPPLDNLRWSFDSDSCDICKDKMECCCETSHIKNLEQCSVRRSNSVKFCHNILQKGSCPGKHDETLTVSHRSQSQGRPSVLPLSPVPSASTLEYTGTPTASNPEVGVGRFTVTRSNTEDNNLSQNSPCRSKMEKMLPSFYTSRLGACHFKRFPRSEFSEHAIRNRSSISCSPDVHRKTKDLDSALLSKPRYSCFTKLFQPGSKANDSGDIKESDFSRELVLDYAYLRNNTSHFSPVMQWLSMQPENVVKSDGNYNEKDCDLALIREKKSRETIPCTNAEAVKKDERSSVRLNRHHSASSVRSLTNQVTSPKRNLVIPLSTSPTQASLTPTLPDEPLSSILYPSGSIQSIMEPSGSQTNSVAQTNSLLQSTGPETAIDDAIINQALNAVTYPSRQSPYHLDIGRLIRAVALGAPFAPPLCRSLISTAVIRGSRDDGQASSSVPDFKRLSEDLNFAPRTLTPGSSKDFLVPSAPCVPEVYPLETLHNDLTLSQLEAFFVRLTTHKFPTPFTSPQHPSTPVSYYHHHSHQHQSPVNLDAANRYQDSNTSILNVFPATLGDDTTTQSCSNTVDEIPLETQQSTLLDETLDVTSAKQSSSAFHLFTSNTKASSSVMETGYPEKETGEKPKPNLPSRDN